MNRHAASRLALALVALLGMTGADGGCERKRTGKVESDRPPHDQPDPATARTVHIRGHSDAPYQVLVLAQELGPGDVPRPGIDRTGPQEIAGGTYEQELTYTSGIRVKILITVWGHRDDEFSCSIEDGSFNRDRQGPSAEHVTCNLVTAR